MLNHCYHRAYQSITLALCVMLVGYFPWSSHACTTVVISGRVTTDGRPILWKNRDTDEARNELAYLSDGQLRAVAVVNAGKRTSVWMGMNEAGFCIENSLSKDLDLPGDDKGLGNGGLMKRALETCKTVADFEALLKSTNNTGRSTTANYGVIDAQGGAAMFETGPNTFTKFDANDLTTAPNGYIVRSNFATTAKELPANPTPEQVEALKIYSGQRYSRACKLIESRSTKLIDVAYVIRTMTRDMADEKGVPFPGSVAGAPGTLPTVIDTSSTISRATTVSAAVFHGVRPDESPLTTTMWTMLGDPKYTIAVPCWVTGSPIADPLEDRAGGELGEIARTLRDWSLTRTPNAINTSILPSIWKDLWQLEDKTIQQVVGLRDVWAKSGFDAEKANAVHLRAAEEAIRAMQTELSEVKQQAVQITSDRDYDDKVRASQKTILVAIYDHTPNVSGGPTNLMRILTEEKGFKCVRLPAETIRSAELNKYDLLIVPGGSASAQAAKIGAEGCQAIKDYVRSGGGYMGICAGSYLASSQYTWSLNLINARVWDRVHWARGTGMVKIGFSEDGMEAMAPAAKSVDVYYGQGPLLVPGDDVQLPPYEVLASYESEIAKQGAPDGAMEQTHAIIRSEFGDGRVICLSPHPEKPDGPDWIITSAVRWAAKNRPETSVRTAD